MKKPLVLITDDEANIRLMLRTALESDGFVVEEAVNGREALDAVAHDVPDVLLLDLSMPVMDGMTVLQQLRDLPPERRPRVVVLTAYGSIPAAVKATRLGAADFLEKPVTPAELRDTLRAVLAEPRPTAVSGNPSVADAAVGLEGGYEGVLDRVRAAMRESDFVTAESLLMRAGDLSAGREAPYFNLLGLLYESNRQWRLARKFYGKAIHADRRYEPAQQNMRRLYELETLGHSKEEAALGDEERQTALQRLLRLQRGKD